ncbi:MAG: universal stress protein [Verrucomicrobiota bacterium]|nr:universal stress protein [Verrucomicrobiota bacterium]
MRFLVPVDLSEATPQVLAVARRAAKASRGSVVLLHIAEPDPAFVGYEAGPPVVRDQVAQEYREQHRALQAHAEEFRADGIETTPLVIQGQIAKCILKEAERVGAELIVMGTHGHGAVFDLIVGGVSHAVLRQTTIPILFVPLRKP